MSLQFARARPLQASKLAAIVATLLYAAGAITGAVPGGLDALLFVIVLGLVLALLVAVETVVAGARALLAADPLVRRLADRRVYAAVRAGEATVALLAAGAFVVTFSTVTSEPLAGPGAIGPAFFGAGLGVLILGTSLVRTLAEYYHYRRVRTA